MRALVLVLGLSVGACSIPEETFIPLACNVTTCGEGSTCVDIDNVASCVCDAGLQDNDGDGNCTATCDTMACPSKMSCDDSSGTATCGCNAGFQDNDKDGTCTYSCEVTDCAGGTCSDATGTATCACGPGLQDKDGDNKCAPSCDNTDCGANGCDDSSGQPICVCDLSCGTNAVCIVRDNVGACECQGSFVDFDGDGNCTATCGSNLLNGTNTGGAASVVSVSTTGSYFGHSTSIANNCNGHRDASGVLCDAAPSTNSAQAFENPSLSWSGPRFNTSNTANGAGILVIDAGSSITFNTLQLYQHFRRYGGIGNSRAYSVRYSVHASTTTAPSATDAGWVTLTSGFEVLPTPQKLGTSIRKPGVWSGSNQTSRFIRVETQSQTYRTGYAGLKGFLCQ